MHWFALYGAIFFEVAGTTSLKYAAGLRQAGIFGLSLGFYAASFAMLAHALKVLPVGVAYAIWSGIGTVAVALIGILWFREAASVLKLVFIAMIVVGAVGLNLISERG